MTATQLLPACRLCRTSYGTSDFDRATITSCRKTDPRTDTVLGEMEWNTDALEREVFDRADFPDVANSCSIRRLTGVIERLTAIREKVARETMKRRSADAGGDR